MAENDENLPEVAEKVDHKKELTLIEEHAKRLDKEYKENVKTDVQQQSMEDAEFARATTYDTIEKLNELFESSVTVAKETEAPRAIEVAANIGKLIIESSHDLMIQQENLIKLANQVDDLAQRTYETEDLPPPIQAPQLENTEGMTSAPQPQVQVQMTTEQLIDMVVLAEEARKNKENTIDVTLEDNEDN